MVAANSRRMTRQRRVILEVLQGLHTHPSADEVYAEVRRRLPRVSLATVYRNLELLSDQGLIRKIGHCDVQMRFDADLHPHFHLRCLECGSLEDSPIEPCSQIDQAVQSMQDLGVIGYRLEFYYRCPSCRGKREATADSQSQAKHPPKPISSAPHHG